MRISEEVKQKTDIVEVVSQYITLNKAGRLLKGLCPFHSEKHGSFFVYPEQQTWHCFGACATGGDVFSFIMKKEGLDFTEALRKLAGRAGVVLPEYRESSDDREKENRLYQANAAAAVYYGNLLLNSATAQKARDYVNKRQIADNSVADFQLGYSPAGWQELTDHLLKNGYGEEELIEAGLSIKSDDGRIHDRFHNMLMFPIVSMKGQVTGFGARVLDSSQPKYINSPQTELFDKGAFPYAVNLAASEIRKMDTAVIVEGYMDVIAAHQAGYKNVVASMGTSVTERQIRILKKLTKNVVFALDADNAGTEATMRGAAFENILDNEIRVVSMPEGKDPDDVLKADPAGWPKLIESAQPLMDFVFDNTAGGLDLETFRGQKELANRLIPAIAPLRKDPIRFPHYRYKLASMTKRREQEIDIAIESYIVETEGIKTAVTQSTATPTKTDTLSNTLEEYCLSLLIRNPELLDQADELAAECFGCGENREIFTVFKKVRNAVLLKESLPAALHSHLHDIMAIGSVKKTRVDQHYQDYLNGLLKGVPASQKFAFCTLSLKEAFLRAKTAKLNTILDMESEPENAEGEFESLRQQCIENNDKIREIQIQKQKLSRNLRR